MDTPANAVPDGGWGWVVVLAVAFINMTNQSILSVFGLLFGSQLHSMQQETATAALITNLNSLVLNFSGLFIGPAIKSFKPRNVAISGCLMVSFGLLLCSQATHCWHFIVGYSFFVGMGLGLIAPSTFMAINSYFSSKRGRAVGVSLAGAGLGQVFIPHLVRLYLDHYGFRAAVLSMSLLSLSGILGALLLRPLKKSSGNAYRKNLNNLIEEKPLSIQIVNNSNTVSSQCDESQTLKNDKVYKDTVQVNASSKKSSRLCSTMCSRVVQAMDLELLLDPVFLSIIIGMALVYTSTINFTMLFPRFLQISVELSRSQTATCMSIVAGADILCRLLLPIITDKLKVAYRLVFLLGTFGLLIARTALAESTDMTNIIVMSIFTGMTKSATVLNNNLTISGHCRAEKLAGGLGLNMIAKGIVVITVGQLLGWIRDYTNSYVICLHAQNVLLLLVVLAWTPEMLYRYRKQRRSRATIPPQRLTSESSAGEPAKICNLQSKC